jgi:hypothetical protein
MFGIETSADFFDKMIEDFDDFFQNPDSPRHAINCALAAYHLHEWVWLDWLETDVATQKALDITSIDDFRTWIRKEVPWFAEVRGIANGSKHFKVRRKPVVTQVLRFDEDDYSEDGYQGRGLDVQAPMNGELLWIDASILVEQIVIFWQEFFKAYRPTDVVKAPKYTLMGLALKPVPD